MNNPYTIGKLERQYADEKTSHLIHLALSVVTVGWWIPVWLIAVIMTISTKSKLENNMKKFHGRMTDTTDTSKHNYTGVRV